MFKKLKEEKDVLSRNPSILSNSSELESIDDNVFQDGCSSLRVEKNTKKKCSSSSSSGDSGIFENFSKFYRLLVLGPSKVGKTSLIRQMLYKTHSYEHIPTLHQMFLGDFQHADSQVSLTIEDTGDDFSHEFPAMMEVSLKATDGIILVFSLADNRSFEDISLIRESISSKYPNIPLLIAGNKTDLERQLPRLETEATVCFDWECGYVECCARDGSNVEKVFDNIITQIIHAEQRV
jgi:RASD family protein 2